MILFLLSSPTHDCGGKNNALTLVCDEIAEFNDVRLTDCIMALDCWQVFHWFISLGLLFCGRKSRKWNHNNKFNYTDHLSSGNCILYTLYMWVVGNLHLPLSLNCIDLKPSFVCRLLLMPRWPHMPLAAIEN